VTAHIVDPERPRYISTLQQIRDEMRQVESDYSEQIAIIVRLTRTAHRLDACLSEQNGLMRFELDDDERNVLQADRRILLDERKVLVLDHQDAVSQVQELEKRWQELNLERISLSLPFNNISL
jgi:hypothetical protein